VVLCLVNQPSRQAHACLCLCLSTQPVCSF
jgi:hypothetical protein